MYSFHKSLLCISIGTLFWDNIYIYISRDTIKNSALTDPVEILEKFLLWGHVAPTCPDTTGCYPVFTEEYELIKWVPKMKRVRASFIRSGSRLLKNIR